MEADQHLPVADGRAREPHSRVGDGHPRELHAWKIPPRVSARGRGRERAERSVDRPRQRADGRRAPGGRHPRPAGRVPRASRRAGAGGPALRHHEIRFAHGRLSAADRHDSRQGWRDGPRRRDHHRGVRLNP